jgi:hypothetical protein
VGAVIQPHLLTILLAIPLIAAAIALFLNARGALFI